MGRRFPDGGLLRYRKLVPQQLGDVIKQGSGDSRPMGVRHGDTVANHTDLLYLLSGCGRPPSHYSMVKRLNIIGKIARAKPAYLCTLMMVCRVSRVSCEPVYLHPFCVVMMSLNG